MTFASTTYSRVELEWKDGKPIVGAVHRLPVHWVAKP